MTPLTTLRTLWAVVTTLGAVTLAAGCMGDDDSSSEKRSAAGGRPANPPATLARATMPEAVTLDDAPDTHDADVTIDRATGRIYVAWIRDGKKRAKPVGEYEQGFPPSDTFVAYSDDRGKTYSEPVRTNPSRGEVLGGFNTGMRIVSTGQDRVLLVYPYNTNTQLSTDGGKTWREPVPVSKEGGGYGAVATYGKNAYVGYLDYQTPETNISVVHTADGGRKLGKPVVAESSACGCCDNALAVDNDGTLFFSYRNVDKRTEKTQVRDTTVVRSYDHGQTWSDPVALGEDNWEFNGCPEAGPELAVDGDNVLHAAYWTGKPGRPGVYYTWSKDDGASFEKPVAVAVEDFYPPPYIDLAVQKDGTGWLVWDDRRTKDRKVHLARVKGGEFETVKGDFDDGVTPAIDSDGSMVVMTWSNDEGFHVSTKGEPARDGFGSGPGNEHSGQDHKKSGHH